MQARLPTTHAMSLVDPTREPHPQRLDAEFEPLASPGQLAEIERCCMALFERWCESRSVVPLAYLMHVWPIPALNTRLARRLSNTLQDLSTSHADTLDPADRQLIRQAINAIDISLQY